MVPESLEVAERSRRGRATAELLAAGCTVHDRMARSLETKLVR